MRGTIAIRLALADPVSVAPVSAVINGRFLRGGQNMIRSKLGQRIIGAVAFLIAGACIVWTWQIATSQGYYYRSAAVMFPVFAVVGIALLFRPIDVEEQQAKFGDVTNQSFAQLPWEWKVLIGVAISAGLGNWYLLAHL
jgi:hypothetical protein